MIAVILTLWISSCEMFTAPTNRTSM